MMQLDEANILSISAASIHGLPMYQPVRSPDFDYSLMYGPITFLIYGLALVAGGVNHFWIIRSSIVLANLGLCWAMYALLRRFISRSSAITLLAFPLSALLQHPEIALGVRSDIWILFFSTLAILFSFLDVEPAAAILSGIAGGLVIGLKISAAPAILFPLLLLYRRFGLRAPVISLLATAAVALAPFSLSVISLRNYISWLLFTRREGLSPDSVCVNILFALFLIGPCLLLELSMRRYGKPFRQRIPEFCVIVLCLVLAISVSKNGSGPYYLWHIVPSILVYIGLILRDMREIPETARQVPIYTITVACLLLVCINLPRAIGHIRMSTVGPRLSIAQQSIHRYLEMYRNHSSIQMGYGSVADSYRSELRYILVYNGQPYTIEGNTDRFETRLLPFPVDVLRGMANCKDDVWLVPHDQQPFDLWVLPDALRKTFLQNYSIDRTDGVYDAWVCNAAAK